MHSARLPHEGIGGEERGRERERERGPETPDGGTGRGAGQAQQSEARARRVAQHSTHVVGHRTSGARHRYSVARHGRGTEGNKGEARSRRRDRGAHSLLPVHCASIDNLPLYKPPPSSSSSSASSYCTPAAVALTPARCLSAKDNTSLLDNTIAQRGRSGSPSGTQHGGTHLLHLGSALRLDSAVAFRVLLARCVGREQPFLLLLFRLLLLLLVHCVSFESTPLPPPPTPPRARRHPRSLRQP